MRKLLKKQSSRKAAGPDNISTSTLKYCANVLATVFTYLFNASLNLHIAPVYFKAASIIPVHKKPKATALNDFRPVALTSVVMKVFERLVLRYLKSVTNSVTAVRVKGEQMQRCCCCIGPAFCYAALGISEHICTRPLR